MTLYRDEHLLIHSVYEKLLGDAREKKWVPTNFIHRLPPFGEAPSITCKIGTGKEKMHVAGEGGTVQCARQCNGGTVLISLIPRPLPPWGRGCVLMWFPPSCVAHQQTRYIPGATLVLSEDLPGFPVFLFPSQFHAWLEEYPQNRENRWLHVHVSCLHSWLSHPTTHTHTHTHTTPAHVYTQWPQTSVRGIRSIGVCPPECVSHLVLSTAIHSWLSRSGIQQWVE